MKRITKLLCLCSIFLSFSFTVFGQPLYKFSGFGGGLPSSAMRVSADDDSLTQDLDDELKENEGKPKKEKMSPKKKAIIITASVIGGVVVIGGIAIGTYFLINETSKCCESAAQGCAENAVETACQNASGGGILSFAENLALFPIYVP